MPEEFGGGGAGLPELVATIEEFGRAVAPGPFLPTLAVSAVIAVSIGGNVDMLGPVDLLGLFRAHGDRLPGAAARIGAHLAESHALHRLNLRRAERAVVGGGPGPEGNITKLVVAEHAQRAAALAAELTGEDTVFADSPGGVGWRMLVARATTIAGGTSEIARYQIAERILGLPRDPLAR